ncbi:non-ribosomal peptide synthetase [Rhodococcus sp. OK302]|uniref:non-ribosomal peptide synthetase n=1 Tax=Rhodococcus sp. OK302 TaxID=1882769 RepID=UPI000B93EA35|nr:non-ribosomal peptide synthetase [Rhodococcus sp. OK302]OYD68847.1 amino acid adenylation domain-containing protein [Rhodococcus sp. OK302]
MKHIQRPTSDPRTYSTPAGSPFDDAVVRRIAQTVKVLPGALAVSSWDGTLDYGELWLRAERLAGDLRTAGVARGDLVALCLPRSADCVVSALAVISVGAAYVALDPRQPDARLRFALADSSAGVLVAHPEVAARVGWPTPIVPSTGVTAESTDVHRATVDIGDAPIEAESGDLAYVVYTSGSTGQPKGVAVQHGGLLNLIDWHQRAFSVTGTDRCTMIASPGFDAAVWELWPALTAGASLHIVPVGLENDPVRLRDWIVAERVTVCFVPTPLAESLIAMTWPSETRLRFLLTGGDVLYHRPPIGLPFTLVNNYGLSEATVVSASGIVEPAVSVGELPPSLGHAIDGVELLVIGDDGLPLPSGEVGELVVRGVSVARGYVGMPELTARKFSGSSDDLTKREYRTGDLVRLNEFGEVEFAGRCDDQIQIRGNRVEIGEVVGVLDRHLAVRASTVILLGERENPKLVAFVVLDGQGFDCSELQTHLAEHLPAHMLPRNIIALESLPTTANGKVDRAALEVLAQTAEQSERGSLAGPRNDVEATLAQIVATRLDLPEVGIDENFFTLGGHSMLGAQLIIRIAEVYGVEMSLLELFDNPTVADMASKVEELLVKEISGMSDDELLEAEAQLAPAERSE